MIEIRIHGTGGQGAVVAAKLLADAAAKSGYKSRVLLRIRIQKTRWKCRKLCADL